METTVSSGPGLILEFRSPLIHAVNSATVSLCQTQLDVESASSQRKVQARHESIVVFTSDGLVVSLFRDLANLLGSLDADDAGLVL
jgi:hypothetical protein